MNSNTEIGQNISNAYKVMCSTYESVDKLLVEIDAIAIRRGFTPLTKSSFLRWRSDKEVTGWLIGDFIKLYKKLANFDEGDLLHGPVYSIGVSLWEKDAPPQIIVAKFLYDLKETPKKRSDVKSHQRFNWPVSNEQNFKIETFKENWFCSTPKSDKVRKSFWGLDMVLFSKIPLLDVQSAEDAETVIFALLEDLVNLPVS